MTPRFLLAAALVLAVGPRKAAGDEPPASVSSAPKDSGSFSLSWDQCFCTKPTGRLIPPYVDVRYDPGPGCGGSRSKDETVWFNCEDASQVLRQRCSCRTTAKAGKPSGVSLRRVWGCGAASVPPGRGAEEFLDCAALESEAGKPQARCFCRGSGGEAGKLPEVVRYNWSKECVALRPMPGWDLAALPSCEDSRAAVGLCYCRNPDGTAARTSREGPCGGLEFVSLILRTAHHEPPRPRWSLPACPGSGEDAPKRGN